MSDGGDYKKMNAYERFLKTINFEEPDRVLTYDLLGNENLIELFGGEGTAAVQNARVLKELGIDATRGLLDIENHWLEVKLDLWQQHYGLDPDKWEVSPDGGTYWISRRPFKDAEGLKKHMPEMPRKKDMADWYIPSLEEITEVFGNDLVFIGATEGPLTDAFDYADMELFMMLMYDAPDLIESLLDVTTEWARNLAELYVEHATSPAFFICDDIAYKTGTMFSPDWLRDNLYDRWKYIYEPVKEAGFKCFFHSDGDLMGVMDDLVNEVGIDGINPLEPQAGMEAKVIREKYPELIILGNIDASSVLPFGTPAQIEEEVKSLIKNVGPTYGLCAGSSTEIPNSVPIENVRALYDSIKKWGKYPLDIG